ncbi:MAG: hypothetical protein ACK58X_05580, partial [Planctomycetota bacterium]
AAASAPRRAATHDPGPRLRPARAPAAARATALAEGLGAGDLGARLARAHADWRARVQRGEQDVGAAARAAAAARRRRAGALFLALAAAAAATAAALWATG